MSDCERLRAAAQRLSDAISDRAASTGLGWKSEMDADAEYLAAVKSLRADLATASDTIDRMGWELDALRVLDVERLATALRYVERTMQDAMGIKPPDDGPPDEWYDGYARAVASRYERLGE